MELQGIGRFLVMGYLLTTLIETPVLLVGLSARHPRVSRLIAGLWLTACTYPVVVLLLPLLFRGGGSRLTYLIAAETFAPVAECALFWAAWGARSEWGQPSMWRDFAAITVANLISFGIGEAMHRAGWLAWASA